MNLRSVFTGLVLLICAAAPALAGDLPKVILDASAKKPQTYRVAGLTLTVRQVPGKEMRVAQLTVASPRAKPVTFVGSEGFDSAIANLLIGVLDTKNPVPQVIMTTYSGGAHCCGRIQIAEKIKGVWKQIDMGLWDGDPMEQFPKDVDGDGIPDLVLADKAFLYAFDCYACSWPPLQIFNIRDGKAIDVTRAPRYAKLIAAEMGKVKAECAKHTNGACAGYVADAAYLGRFDEAWQFMLANYRKNADYDLPSRCLGKMVDYACKDHEVKPRDYPESLRWFLEDHGYIPKPH